MKKIITLFLIFILIFSIVGCNNKSPQELYNNATATLLPIFKEHGEAGSFNKSYKLRIVKSIDSISQYDGRSYSVNMNYATLYLRDDDPTRVECIFISGSIYNHSYHDNNDIFRDAKFDIQIHENELRFFLTGYTTNDKSAMRFSIDKVDYWNYKEGFKLASYENISIYNNIDKISAENYVDKALYFAVKTVDNAFTAYNITAKDIGFINYNK